MSQKLTLSPTDLRDIERIKPLLLEGKSQLDISLSLHKRRETINRKISKWIKTEDFNTWVSTAWLDKYQKVDDVEAFRALTKLMCKRMPTKAEIKSLSETRTIEVVWHVNAKTADKLSTTP